ncbi:MAG: Tn3 family transposase [Chloroflexota bacterium]
MKEEISSRTKSGRLKILESNEVEAIYGLPLFDDEDREFYFALSSPEKEVLSQLHGRKSSIYFILQLGFFKARRQFFILNLQQVAADAKYVQRRYFPDYDLNDLAITKVTRLKQQRLILELLQYRVCGELERQQLRKQAQQIVQISGRPVYVFRELLTFLDRQQLVAPGYTVLQEMIGEVLQREKERLIEIAASQLDEGDIGSLNALLTNPQGLHEITKIKREPKDFSLKETNREIERGRQIKPLYDVAQVILPHLAISNESIKYYASLINYYSVFQMSQLEENLARIYLLCFVHHRYQRLHDNLINCFIYRVRQLLDEAKSAAKESIYTHRLEQNRNLVKARQVLRLFGDETISPETPFVVVQKQAFDILPQDKLSQVANHILQAQPLDEQLLQWKHFDQMGRMIKRRLWPLVKMIDFSATKANQSLITAAHFLKEALHNSKPLTQFKQHQLPQRFIPVKHRRYLYETDEHGKKRLLVGRYESLIYRQLRNQLESGDVFCRHSIRFRSFEDDLLKDEQWQDKESILAQIGLPILNQTAESHIAELKQTLETKLEQVNNRIAAGENDQIVIKRSGRWHLPYSRINEDVNNPFFESLPQVDIQAIFQFADQHCQFLNQFTHVLHRYAGRKADTRTLIAAILAWGTNMGLGRMGQTSDVNYQSLTTISNNFIRLETLQKANAVVANAIAQLPIFQQFHIGGAVHSSSDGQKYETLWHTINARYSPKYFGLMKGMVAYTLVANHIPVSARIIGANEHESHYVFDLLHNNLTNIQPIVHSTDTHGTNEVNFGILHFFGYQFAPRYRDLYDKVGTGLYGFKHPSQYSADWLLQPIRKIKEKLIEVEWENIQRIIASLALKTTTQSIIIGKLSAYARKNRTKQALWEYDNIIRSLYLLEYIDSLFLRRHVQKALNRGEGYHKLHKAVSFANFGKLRFKTEGEQEIWNECGRLIVNCIIFYNAMILSNVLHHHQETGKAIEAAALERVSPVAWQHINFYGRYEFTKAVQPIDLDLIVQELVGGNTSSKSDRLG